MQSLARPNITTHTAMISFLLNTGLLDPALAVAVLGLIRSWFQVPARLAFGYQRLIVVLLAMASFGSLGLGLYRSYSVPRDVMQDIIAAQEFSLGRPMHPKNMNEKMKAALDAEGPRPSLLTPFPSMAEREEEQRKATLEQHWVQAHPPAMTLMTVPFVTLFGPLGTQVVFSAIAILSLGVVLRILHRELWPIAPPLVWFGVVLAVFGWAPVCSGIRLQQPGLLLLALATFAWSATRRGSPIISGTMIAAASLLKIVPAILLVAMSLKSRSTFLSAIAILLLLSGVILLIVPWTDLRDYHEAAQEVLLEYSTYSSNISILGAFARFGRAADIPFEWSKAAWFISAIALIVCLFRRNLPLLGKPIYPAQPLEYNLALGLSLIPLLSPVAWDHYEVFHLISLAIIARSVCRNAADRHFRSALWLILIGLALPEQFHIWLHELALNKNLFLADLLLITPMRAYLGLAIIGWVWSLRKSSALGQSSATSANYLLLPLSASTTNPQFGQLDR